MAHGPEAHAGEAHAHSEQAFIWKYVFSKNHRIIGIQYYVTAMVMALVAGLLAMLIRLQLAWPAKDSFGGYGYKLQTSAAVDSGWTDDSNSVVRDGTGTTNTVTETPSAPHSDRESPRQSAERSNALSRHEVAMQSTYSG